MTPFLLFIAIVSHFLLFMLGSAQSRYPINFERCCFFICLCGISYFWVSVIWWAL